MSGAMKGKPAGVLVRDGDLVLVFGDKNEAYFIYQASDGPVLNPTFKEGRMLLSGKVVSLSLQKGGAAWEWLEKASTQELAGVSFLVLPKNLMRRVCQHSRNWQMPAQMWAWRLIQSSLIFPRCYLSSNRECFSWPPCPGC